MHKQERLAPRSTPQTHLLNHLPFNLWTDQTCRLWTPTRHSTAQTTWIRLADAVESVEGSGKMELCARDNASSGNMEMRHGVFASLASTLYFQDSPAFLQISPHKTFAHIIQEPLYRQTLPRTLQLPPSLSAVLPPASTLRHNLSIGHLVAIGMSRWSHQAQRNQVMRNIPAPPPGLHQCGVRMKVMMNSHL